MTAPSTARGGAAQSALVGAALLLMAPAAAARQRATAAPPDDQVRVILPQLEDPSFERRVAATAELESLVGDDPLRLFEYLQESQLSAEQRCRMLMVFAETLVDRPLGALGIRMNPQPMRFGQGVEVADVTPGMPAEKLLRIGDVIQRMDGMPVGNSESLKNYVQAKRPGDIVVLTVDRPRTDKNGLRVFDERNNQPVYDTIKVNFELGSLQKLNEINGAEVDASAVLNEQQRQIGEALRLFGPQPREIQISNHRAMVRAMTAGPDAGTDVDEHPIIQAMLRDIDRIVSGNRPITDADRARWDSFQIQLSNEYQNPRASSVDKAYILRVITRFLALRPHSTSQQPIGSPSHRGGGNERP